MVEEEKERTIDFIVQSIPSTCRRLNLNIGWIQELAVAIGTESVKKGVFSKIELRKPNSIIGTSIYESVKNRPQWRSLKEIAEVVGVSKGTIFNRHKKMERVAGEVIEKWHSKLQINKCLSKIEELQRKKIYHVREIGRLFHQENGLIAEFNKLANKAEKIEIIIEQERKLTLERAEIKKTETFKGFQFFVEETYFTGHSTRGAVIEIPTIDIGKIKEIKIVEWKEEE